MGEHEPVASRLAAQMPEALDQMLAWRSCDLISH